MDFSLTSEQQALADSLKRFCTRHYSFDDRKKVQEAIPRSHDVTWGHFAELGWLGAALPEDRGGYGGSAIENMIIMEQFGRSLLLEPFLEVAVLTLQTLAALPGSEATDRLISAVINGETLAVLAESQVPQSVDSAMPDVLFDGQRLSGTALTVVGAATAHQLIVPGQSDSGLGLYLVEAAAAGVAMTSYRLLDNRHAADVQLQEVAPLAILAAGPPALDAMKTGYAHALIALCAEALGAMDAAIGLTREHLKTRKQFGTTLNNFQALQHRMADMLVELELSRSMVHHGIAALRLPEKQRTHAISAMKAVVSTAAQFIGRNSIQLHGAIGMTEEYAIGHYYRRLFVIATQFGGEGLHLRRMTATETPFWAIDGREFAEAPPAR